MTLLNREIRRRIVEKGKELNFGHYGSAMSCVDACVHLYKHILKKDDVFIMSKGHAIVTLLPILESLGRQVEWKSYIHFESDNFVEATTASLGHGLAIGVGRALAKQIQNKPGNIYVMIGDGELQEGSIWEALIILNKLNLKNLFLLVDWNKYQAVDSVEEIVGDTGDLIHFKLEAFGRKVIKLDGHDEDSLSEIKYLDRETFDTVILDTVKGMGIHFLQMNPSFHVLYMHEHPDIYNQAMEDLL